MEKSKKTEDKKLSVTIKLEYPIEWGSETITEIVLRRPKTKHIKHLGAKSTMSEVLLIAAKCSGIAPAMLGEFDAKDGIKIAETIQDFLGDGLEISDKDW